MVGSQCRRYFADRPLVFYGAIYAFLTLSFATAFWMMPGQFYHSTAGFEPILVRDAVLIKEGLQRALIEQARRYDSSETISVSGADFPIDRFTIIDLNYNNGRFFVFCVLHNDTSSTMLPELIIDAKPYSKWLFVEAPNEQIEVSSDHAVIDASFQVTDWERVNIGEAFQTTADPENLIAPPAPPVLSAVEIGNSLQRFVALRNGDVVFSDKLETPRELRDRMNGHAEAKDGYAGRATGSFWRMVYLSTVTITTVGYGDIVPITTMARTLVAAEAVLGIVVIGLYLNALSQRFRQTEH